jgi:indolepyruvate ferredoxin oxidoreductase beta subunit
MSPRPINLLIAALGGEGGGVLTSWVIAAAARHGLPAQSTSIPGVAQRTGATTYYIEILPVAAAELGGRRPVFALHPGIGDVDLLLASELLEAGRAVATGFVTPDRTFVIASTHRFFVMEEKMAMGDGRLDGTHLVHAIERHAKQSRLFDMAKLANQSGSMVNAVMLGAIAGSGVLPIPPELFEAAIRQDGRAVEGNLRGFGAGLAAVRRRVPARPARPPADEQDRAASATDALLAKAAAELPAAAREIVLEGIRRLIKYQDVSYAQLYLRRLAKVREADARTDAGGRLLREAARHLALRMSFEDVIRVAQAKLDPARFARIAKDMHVGAGEPFAVVEFLKPGMEELASVLPPRLAGAMLWLSRRSPRLARLHWGMAVRSTSVTGYLQFRLLRALRCWRPRTHRFRQEQQAIEAWLARIAAAAEISADLAIEVAECARLIKGYGDTHKRGSANYLAIDARIIRPALAGRIPAARAIDAVASARTAALADAEGENLARCLAEIEAGMPAAPG